MPRYMNADKLLEYLEKEAESAHVKYSFIGAGVQATISVIKTFPLEDVAPVVHAHWEDCSNGWMCSNCYRDRTYETDYCPNCGAKMDEEVEDA